MSDSPEEIERDVRAVGRIDCVPALLRIVSEATGMRFAAVARVTEGSWTACAVHDEIQFGLVPAGQLDVHTTLCKEVRQARAPIVIDHASVDDRYCDHHTPRTYRIESYISVPIVLSTGEYFGNLCAIDPKPARVSDERTMVMFERFAAVIATQLENDRHHERERQVMLNERETGELRDQFIAALGHDLRDPISYSGKLLERHVDSDVAATGRRIATSARRMSGLIEDILDFARSKLGVGIVARIEEIPDLGPALQALLRELEDAHPGRAIERQIETPYAVWCDLPRVEQLISNLVSNALTHGATDRPVVVLVRSDEENLVLEVFNEGEPIGPASLEKIFDPFWRESKSRAREGLAA